MRKKLVENLLTRFFKRESKPWVKNQKGNENLWARNLFSDLEKLGGHLIVMRMG